MTSSTYNDSSEEINNKDANFKIGYIVRILKHKNIFAKGYTPSWSEEVFVIRKDKNMLLMILMGKKLLVFLRKRFSKKKLKRVYNWKSYQEKIW